MKPNLLFKICLVIAAIGLLLPLVVSALSSDKTGTNVSIESSKLAGEEAQVLIDHMAFDPSSVTVKKGTRVTWVDKQSLMPHTVTSDSSGIFDSGNLHKDNTFSFTFNNAGVFTYHCTHHKKMHGTVIVK